MDNPCDISFELLVDYHDRKLKREESVQVDKHLASGCSLCHSNLNDISRLLTTLRAEVLAHAPQPALQRAYALFHPKSSISEAVRQVASLIFDSRVNRPLTFARGARGEAVQKLYEAESVKVDIWEEPQSESKSYLIGQVMQKETEEAIAPLRVIAYPEKGEGIEAHLDSGEFHFSTLFAGTYDIEVQTMSGQIYLQDVVIGD